MTPPSLDLPLAGPGRLVRRRRPVATAAPGPLTPADGERLRLAARVRVLSWLSLAWMTAEGAVAITAGVLAGSIALVGFGIDSAIEGLASAIIVWRFTGARVFSAAAENRAQKLVAVQFFLLAPYVAYESISALATGEQPDVTVLGIALAATSLVVMPVLGIAKQRLADRLGSAATKGEGRQNMLCAYLAAALLLGLLANALFGAGWLDPVVGLLIAGVAVKEGLEAWRGEGCCVVGPLPAGQGDACGHGCCDGRRAAPGQPATASVANRGRLLSDLLLRQPRARAEKSAPESPPLTSPTPAPRTETRQLHGAALRLRALLVTWREVRSTRLAQRRPTRSA